MHPGYCDPQDAVVCTQPAALGTLETLPRVKNCSPTERDRSAFRHNTTRELRIPYQRCGKRFVDRVAHCSVDPRPPRKGPMHRVLAWFMTDAIRHIHNIDHQAGFFTASFSVRPIISPISSLSEYQASDSTLDPWTRSSTTDFKTPTPAQHQDTMEYFMSHEEADRQRQRQEREELQHDNETAKAASSMESSRKEPAPPEPPNQKEPVSTSNKMERLRAAFKSILGPRKPPSTTSS